MSKKKKYILFGIFISLLLFLVIVTLFFLETNSAQRIIQSKINSVIQGNLSWETLRFSLISGKIELQNVQLKNKAGEELAGFDRLFVDYSLATLLQGTFTVNSLMLEKLRGAVRVNKEGKINLEEIFPSSKQEQKPKKEVPQKGIPINVIIKELRLRNASVSYENESESIKAVLEKIDLFVDGNLLAQSGNLKIQISKGYLKRQDILTELAQPIVLNASIKEGRIDPIELSVAASPATFKLAGNIQDIFTKPLLNLDLDLTTSLQEIRNILRLKPELTGNMQTRLTLRGTVDNPELTFLLTYGGGILAGNRIDSLNFDFQMKDRLLTVSRLNADAASGNLNLTGEIDLTKAFANGFTSSQRDLESISYKLFLKQNNIRLEQLLPNSPMFSGTVNSDISVTGKGISPQRLSTSLTLDLAAKKLTASKVAAPIDFYLKTEAEMTEGLITLKMLNAKAGDLNLESNGKFNLSSEAVNLNLTLNAPHLAATLSPLGISGVSGALEVKTNVSGTVKQPIFDASIRGGQLRFRDIVIGNFKLNAATDQSGILRVSQLSLENQKSILEGKGTIQVFKESLNIDPLFPLHFALTLRNIEPGNFINKEIATGILDADITLEGSLPSLKGNVLLKGKNLAIEAAQIGDLDLGLRLSEGKVYVDKASLRNHNSDLEISGSVKVLETGALKVVKDPSFEINVESKAIFLENVAASVKKLPPMGGKLSLVANFKGSVTQPEGTINLQGTDIDTGVQKINGILLSAALNKDRVELKSLEVVIVPGESIKGTGFISLQKAYQFNLESTGISLNHIDAIQKQNIADGKINFDLSGKGTIEDPSLNGNINLTELQIKGNHFNDCNIRLDVEEQQAKISGKMNCSFDKSSLSEIRTNSSHRGGDCFDVNARFHLKNKDFLASVVFDNTDLSSYFKIVKQNDLGGRLNGKIEAKGNAGASDAIQAIVDLSKLELLFKQKEILSTQDFKAVFKDETITISDNQISLLKDGRIRIGGTGKLKGPLDIKLSGKIPLQAIAEIAGNLPNITGDLILSARMEGTTDKPDIQSQIELKQIGMTVPHLMQELSDLNGRILLTSEAVTLEGIEGKLDTGRFDISGKIELKNFQPSKVMVNARTQTLPVKIPQMLDVLLNTDLKIQGTPEKSVIQGEIVILEGTYYKNVKMNLLTGLTGIVEKKREESSKPSEITNPFLKNMTFDVAVKSRNPFQVKNNLARLDMKPDLRLNGKLNNPLISGRAQVESGTITYEKQNFVIKKGVVDFVNPYKIEPSIDIEGQAKIRTWDVFLNITGSPDNLRLQFSSKPPEQDGDIISLLIFGKTTHELISGEGGTSQSPSQMLAEMVAKSVGEKLKKETGLDVFEVEVYGEKNGKESSDRVKVTLGKDLSRRMSVKYTMDSKNGEMVQRAIAEYKFLENILVSGFQDNKGAYGGELQFRLEFR